ncbi:hypothetical protein [Teichococcus aestuarii]
MANLSTVSTSKKSPLIGWLFHRPAPGICPDLVFNSPQAVSFSRATNRSAAKLAVSHMTYDLDAAIPDEQPAKAGLAKGFEVNLDYTAEPPFADIAQAIQANLALIGIGLCMNPGGQPASRQPDTRPAA